MKELIISNIAKSATYIISKMGHSQINSALKSTAETNQNNETNKSYNIPIANDVQLTGTDNNTVQQDSLTPIEIEFLLFHSIN